MGMLQPADHQCIHAPLLVSRLGLLVGYPHVGDAHSGGSNNMHTCMPRKATQLSGKQQFHIVLQKLVMHSSACSGDLGKNTSLESVVHQPSLLGAATWPASAAYRHDTCTGQSVSLGPFDRHTAQGVRIVGRSRAKLDLSLLACRCAGLGQLTSVIQGGFTSVPQGST